LPPARAPSLSHAPATPHISTLSLHDALPICSSHFFPTPASAAASAPRSATHRAAVGRTATTAAWPRSHVCFASPRSPPTSRASRSEGLTSELQSLRHLVCRLLLEKKNITN